MTDGLQSKRGKWTGLVVMLALAVAITFAVHMFVSIDDLKNCETAPTTAACARADAIVVVSGGDTAARVSEAVELYDNGWAPLMIVSGAAQDTSGPSNAETMRQQAIDAGVPADAILTDEAAQDTNQNATGSAELARTRDVRNVIVVTSPYHMARAMIIFDREFAGVGPVRGHPSDFDNNWTDNWWLTARGWWLVGGELVKSGIELTRGTVQNETSPN